MSFLEKQPFSGEVHKEIHILFCNMQKGHPAQRDGLSFFYLKDAS